MLPPTGNLRQDQTLAPLQSTTANLLISGWRLNFAAGFAPLVQAPTSSPQRGFIRRKPTLWIKKGKVSDSPL